MIKFFAGVTLAVVLLSVGIGVGYASRNSTGTMSGVNGPYVTNTTISSSAINARFSDIETEISDSLSRSGKGGMTAPLRTADGSVAAPAWSFTSDTGSGWYRIGSSDLGFAVNGTKKLELTSTLFTVTPAATLSGGLTEAAVGDKVLQVGTTFPLLLLAGASGTPAIGFNTYWDGTNNKYAANGFAAKQTMDASGNVIFYTAPSGTAAANLTLTERFRVNSTTVAITDNATISGTLIVGSGNVSTISGFSRGGCTLNGASPSTCTLAVVSGQTCVASFSSTGVPPASGLRTNNSAGTVTVTGANGLTDGVNIVCF